MPASEIQKKAAVFVFYTVILILILVMFPSIEEWLRVSVAARYGIVVSPDYTVTLATGEAASMMTVTYVSLVITLLHLAEVLLGMTLVIGTVRFISFLITKTVYRNAASGEISSLLNTVFSIIVYIVSFFIIFQSVFPTIQLTPLFTGSTILGIVVGLALQDTLGNLFAGLALQADQSFQIGDVIAIPNRGTGVVESVSWRGVKIRTFQNKLLVISNAALGKESIEVAPKGNLNARLVFFSTIYTESPANTIHLVREVVRHSDNVSPKIRPIVRIKELGADGIDWEVKYWLDDYSKYNDSDALIRQRIWYVLEREKISFAYPTRTVYMETKPAEAAPEDVFNAIAERLNSVSIFAPLSDEEIERLANVSKSRIYAPGEAIVRMGQEGNSMFVIIRGSVKVQINEKDYQKTIGTLGENDFFGEMSLLTGEPRSANVIAVEESEVLRIDKEGLGPIFESNPALVNAISELVEERRVLLTSLAEDDEPDPNKKVPKTVMKSIRKFFGMK
ncbi:MAG: cyclic nucleotide-binding domain-containing protein [Pyrinomonadaceae bacterium]